MSDQTGEKISFDPTIENLTPIFSAMGKTAVKIVGGFMQEKSDTLIADAVLAHTRLSVADQRIRNRIAQSQRRLARGASGQDTADLDIVMQIALEGERQISRIKSAGQITASQWRMAGKQAKFSAIGETFFDLATGIGESLGQGLFRTTPFEPEVTTLPATGGPAAIDPMKVA